MTEKQKIEVGQVWRIRAGNNYGTVVGVSPAWIKLDDDVDVRNFRRGDFLKNWMPLVDPLPLAEIEMPADPEVMPDYQPAEADPGSRIAMAQAILAFKAQTGATLKESDIWLVMLNFYVIVERMKLKGVCECIVMYKQCMNEESRGEE